MERVQASANRDWDIFRCSLNKCDRVRELFNGRVPYPLPSLVIVHQYQQMLMDTLAIWWLMSCCWYYYVLHYWSIPTFFTIFPILVARQVWFVGTGRWRRRRPITSRVWNPPLGVTNLARQGSVVMYLFVGVTRTYVPSHTTINTCAFIVERIFGL